MSYQIFKESWQVARHYTWSLNINQLIINYYFFNLFNHILFRIVIYIWTILIENLMGHTYKNCWLEIKMGWLIKCDLIINKF